MPFGEEISFHPIITAAGQPLPALLVGALTSWYLEQSLNIPGLFALRFSDPRGELPGTEMFMIGTEVRIEVQANGEGSPVPLFTGEVTAVELEIDDGGSRTTVRGMDVAHRLLRGTVVETYLNMTAGDIARKVAQRAGVALGTVDSGGRVYEHVAQQAMSDWEFLQLLARQSGAVVSIKDGKLNFASPPAAAEAPSGGHAAQSAEIFEKGWNLLALRGAITAADQTPEVEIRGWDMKNKTAVVETSPAGTRTAQPGKYGPKDLASTVHSPKFVVPAPHLEDATACKEFAAAVSARLSGSFAELEGTVRGNARLKAGTAVAIRNCGDAFDGKYTLTSVRHESSGQTGYVTHFCISSMSDRSLFATASGMGATHAVDATSGVLSGIVTDVADPDQLGRVKVKIPVLSDQFESWWARTVQPGAGAGRGMAVLPEVGDEVLVAFARGGLMQPFVIGGLYNGKDKPDKAWSEHVDRSAGTVTRRAFTSRTGMLVEFLEASGEEKLTISSNGGKQRITLVQTGAGGIEIEAQGAVSVKASKDITVSTDTGTLSLKGNKVSIEASADLLLKGARVTVDAQSSLDAKGATVKVAGTGTLEVSSSGVTTVKGSLVKIN